jgi:hypothetical protein
MGLLSLLISIICAVVVLFANNNINELRLRVYELEQIIKSGKSYQIQEKQQTPINTDPILDWANKPTVDNHNLDKQNLTNTSQSTEARPHRDIWEWFQKDVLVKIGALMILLAVIWFLNNVLGVLSNEVKLLITILLSLALYCVGLYYLKTRKILGEVLLALGTVSAIISLSVGHFLLGITPWIVVIIASIILIGIVYYVAYSTKSNKLAYLATLGFYIVPFLSYSGNNSSESLLVYLLVVNTLVALTMVKMKWFRLSTLSVLMTIIYIGVAVVIHSVSHSSNIQNNFDSPTFWLIVLDVMTLFVINIFQTIDNNSINFFAYFNNFLINLLTVIIIPLLFFNEYQNISLIALVLLMYTLAFVLFSKGINKNYIYIQLISTIGLITFLIFSLFGASAWLPLILALEFLVASIVFKTVFRYAVTDSIFLILQLLPLMIVFFDLLWVSNRVFEMLLTLLLIMGHILYLQDKELEPLDNILFFITGGLLLRNIWLVIELLLDFSPLATIISMVLLTVLSIVGIFVTPSRYKSLEFRIFSALVLCFVLARLFLIDVWLLDVPFRIVVFIVIGALLILTTFINKKK